MRYAGIKNGLLRFMPWNALQKHWIIVATTIKWSIEVWICVVNTYYFILNELLPGSQNSPKRKYIREYNAKGYNDEGCLIFLSIMWLRY